MTIKDQQIATCIAKAASATATASSMVVASRICRNSPSPTSNLSLPRASPLFTLSLARSIRPAPCEVVLVPLSVSLQCKYVSWFWRVNQPQEGGQGKGGGAPDSYKAKFMVATDCLENGGG